MGLSDSVKSKMTSVGDWLDGQEWFQDIKSKFEGLDPTQKTAVKVGSGLAAFLLVFFGVGSLYLQVHQIKTNYQEKVELLALINAANEELKNLKSQNGSNSLALTEGGTWNTYFETLVTGSGVDQTSMTVSPEKPGASTEQSRETLLDIQLKKINIKQIIKVAHSIETGPRPVKLRNLTIDTKEDPDGYLDAVLSISAFKLIQQ